MNTKVNNAVKFREWWRPFAPSFKKEAASEYLESATDSPFMILTAQVRPEKRAIIPAVTHVDGSARPQTVEKETNPLYWRLIDEFGKRTGVPVIMNTSFNLRGEAIVHTPTDAVRTFLAREWMRFALAVLWWRSNLNLSEGRLGRAFLRFAAPFTKLRYLPVIGPGLRWVSARFLPRDTLTWVQVQRGPARGIWLKLNPRTGRDYFNGEVEPEVQVALGNYLRPGMTVYDIGANIGFFSLLAARLVGAAGRVTAFEADPEIARRLRENVMRNQGAPISVEEKAVWSCSKPVFFARADAAVSPDRGLGYVINNDTERSAAGTIRVEAVSVDEYMRKSGAPDFIKCDVEGAEAEVFRGAEKLLNENAPLILCEMHGEENRQTLLKSFANLGYSCEPCGENHILAQHSK